MIQPKHNHTKLKHLRDLRSEFPYIVAWNIYVGATANTNTDLVHAELTDAPEDACYEALDPITKRPVWVVVWDLENIALRKSLEKIVQEAQADSM